MMRDGLVAATHICIALVEPSRTVQHIVTDIVGAWGHEVRPFGNAPEALAYLASDKDVRTLITSTELQSLFGRSRRSRRALTRENQCSGSTSRKQNHQCHV